MQSDILFLPLALPKVLPFGNKNESFSDFKGNYSDIIEIEEWIATNYGKENDKDSYKTMKEWIEIMNKEIKIQMEQKKRMEENVRKGFETGDWTGSGNNASNETNKETSGNITNNETKKENKEVKKETDL